MFGIHGVDRPREVTGAQVTPHGGAHAADTVRCADDDDRLRLQQPVETANAHVFMGSCAEVAALLATGEQSLGIRMCLNMSSP